MILNIVYKEKSSDNIMYFAPQVFVQELTINAKWFFKQCLKCYMYLNNCIQYWFQVSLCTTRVLALACSDNMYIKGCHKGESSWATQHGSGFHVTANLPQMSAYVHSLVSDMKSTFHAVFPVEFRRLWFLLSVSLNVWFPL